MIGNLRKGCIYILLVLCCFSAHLAMAAELREEEVEALRVEIASMLASLEQGDIGALLDKTHPVLYDMGVSRELLARSMHEALEGIRAAKTRYVSSEMGRPTELYPAGDEELCFVPRVSIIESSGRRIRSTTFMIAIRPVGGGEWRYLDGSGLRRSPELLYRFFPGLQPDVRLPPNAIELLPEKQQSENPGR